MKTEELIKAKKYIEHVIGTIKHDLHLGTIQIDWCSHRNIIYLYLVDNDLVKVVEGIDGNY